MSSEDRQCSVASKTEGGYYVAHVRYEFMAGPVIQGEYCKFQFRIRGLDAKYAESHISHLDTSLALLGPELPGYEEEVLQWEKEQKDAWCKLPKPNPLRDEHEVLTAGDSGDYFFEDVGSQVCYITESFTRDPDGLIEGRKYRLHSSFAMFGDAEFIVEPVSVSLGFKGWW